MFEELIRDWDGEEVVVRYDEPSSTWMFVGVHSTVLGPAMGGTRMKAYATPADGLRDVLRLSGAMTLKNSAAQIPFGGGKAVLAVPEIPSGKARRTLLLRYGEMVASLGGTYVTAADMNTGSADLDVIGETCPHVLGRSPQNGGSGDSGPATAVGVFHGIRASVRHVFGTDDLAERTVLVQGVGSVGGRLAELLTEADAAVLVADLDEERASALADRLGAKVVPPTEAIGTACDVFAPCATGGIIGPETIPKLRCRIVAGGANNQLGTPADAERLREAAILYAPDFVVNAGGVLHLACLETLKLTKEQLDERLAGIGDALTRVFETAETEGVSTEEAAEGIARARIAAGRAEPA